VDLGYAISSGAQPAFGKTITSFEACLRDFPELAAIQPGDKAGCTKFRHMVMSLDVRLGNALQDLQEFSQLANMLFQSGEKVQSRASHKLLESVQYRLLHLHYGQGHKLAEVLRLTLLAYMTTLFSRFPGTNMRYSFLADRLRTLLRSFYPASPEERHVYAWSLVVVAMTVFNHSREAWLEEAFLALIRPSLGSTWAEARQRLKEFLWIDALHDKTGVEAIRRNMQGNEFEVFCSDWHDFAGSSV
jgi:hypothetical protein